LKWALLLFVLEDETWDVCDFILGLSKNKPNGQPIRVPIDASNTCMSKIKITKDRQDLMNRKAANNDKLKGKTTEKEARA